MKRCFQDKTLRLPSNENLILCDKHGDPIFLMHFFNVHIINVNYTKFQKKLIV